MEEAQPGHSSTSKWAAQEEGPKARLRRGHGIDDATLALAHIAYSSKKIAITFEKQAPHLKSKQLNVLSMGKWS